MNFGAYLHLGFVPTRQEISLVSHFGVERGPENATLSRVASQAEERLDAQANRDGAMAGAVRDRRIRHRRQN